MADASNSRKLETRRRFFIAGDGFFWVSFLVNVDIPLTNNRVFGRLMLRNVSSGSVTRLWLMKTRRRCRLFDKFFFNIYDGVCEDLRNIPTVYYARQNRYISYFSPTVPPPHHRNFFLSNSYSTYHLGNLYHYSKTYEYIEINQDVWSFRPIVERSYEVWEGKW